jgi:iron complex outermembrane receptor protein
VYKVSGKWDVFGPLSLRGSYGTNYQAPPAGLIPGNITNGVNSYTRVAGSWLGAQTVTRSDIVPETATSWNVGAIWQSQGFGADHDLRIIVDYFDIETVDELGLLANANQIANGVFRFNGAGVAFANQDGTTIAGQTPVNTGAALADCSHPLVVAGRVSFNGGSCVQGTTVASSLNSIRTDFGNGPGQHIAGYDLQINYEMPFLQGDLTFGATATLVSTDENSETVLDGFTVAPADDRLGFLNFAVVGDASSELRGNLFANYRLDRHNFRLSFAYVSGVDDERFSTLPAASTAPAGNIPGTTPGNSTVGTPFGPTGWGVFGRAWETFDFTYLFEVTEDLRLTASVANILDKDPPASRQELGYDPRIGNALGRTFEIGVKKTF